MGSNRDTWKSQDRELPSCIHCGTALYDQFWGNGGWVPTEKVSDVPHTERRCRDALKAEMTRVRAELAASESSVEERVAAFVAEHDRQCKASQKDLEAAEAERDRLMARVTDDRYNCNHRVDGKATACAPRCQCYCTGCFTERVCGERDRFRAALEWFAEHGGWHRPGGVGVQTRARAALLGMQADDPAAVERAWAERARSSPPSR